MVWKDPWILLLIPLILLLVFWRNFKKKPAGFRFSSTDLLGDVPSSWKIKFFFIPETMRLLVLILFVIALAGPRQVLQETIHHTEGIDIVLAMDCSGSMAAEDFKINGQRFNRLMIVKEVVRDFIRQRTSDKIGLVAFAGLAYTACPLTTDYDWLIANLERIELGVLQEDGTAVGSAISSSVNRLKNSQAKSKVVILLTDGVNNAGKIDPITAAKIAKTMGIKVYTIGAGSKGYVPFPMKDFFGRTVYQNVPIDLDEDTLQEIARLTDGKYFRATDTESLRQIYQEIDKLEKTKMEEVGYKEYQELFVWVLSAAVLILVLEVILSNTVFLRIP